MACPLRCQLSLVLLVLSVIRSECQNLDTTTGNVFFLQLSRNSYFDSKDAAKDDPVRFIPSAQHYPDPPDWLRFSQRDYTQDGYLYGVPGSPSDCFPLEVVAVNQRTQQFAYKTMNITVLPGPDDAKYIVELRVLNYDIEDLLSGDPVQVILNKVHKLWRQGEPLRIVTLKPLPEVEGVIRVPESPGEILKEGVVIQIGGSAPFSKDLQKLQIEIQGDACNGGEPDSVSASSRFKGFQIDWCNVRLIESDMDVKRDTAPSPSPVPLDGSPWIPASADVPRRDFFLDFILILVLPSALALLLFFILSYIMFGRREGVDKRDERTPETQLTQFHSLRRATTNLRLMSQRRDGPPPLHQAGSHSPLPVTPASSTLNTRVGSPGVSRGGSQPPPPYRLPPGYSQDTLGRSNRALGSSDAHVVGQDEAQPMRESSPETLRVRK